MSGSVLTGYIAVHLGACLLALSAVLIPLGKSILLTTKQCESIPELRTLAAFYSAMGVNIRFVGRLALGMSWLSLIVGCYLLR